MLISLHKQPTTTPKIRAAIQASADPAWMMAERYGISEQTAWKWRKRDSVHGLSHTLHGLQTTLSPAQEAVAGTLRTTLLLPLDDLLAVVREFLNPHVSRLGLFSATAMADAPIVQCFEFVGGDHALLIGTLPDADIRAVAAGEPAPGLDDKVLLGSAELGLDHLWVIVQLVTDQTCNAQSECDIRVLHSSPEGYLTVADVMAIDVASIEDRREPVPLLFLRECRDWPSGAATGQPIPSTASATMT
jgi:hypothetical protein